VLPVLFFEKLLALENESLYLLYLRKKIISAFNFNKQLACYFKVLHITSDMCRSAIGGKAKASSILTIEPRRRKFHKSIGLTIPLPGKLFIFI